MMMSWHGKTFCITVPLWGESTGHKWIPPTGHKWIPLMKGQLFRVVMFVYCYSKQAVKETVKFQWFVMSWYSCDVTLMHTLLCLIGGWWYVNAWLDCINIDAGYGLAPVLCQAFAWHNFDFLSIETSKTTCKMQMKNIFKDFELP